MEKDKDLILPASILFAAILISGAIFYSRAEQSPSTGQNNDNNNLASLIVADRDVVLGDAKAPVTVIVYADYQCPFCGRFFTESEKRIRDEYVSTGKVKLVHRNFAFLDSFPGVTTEESHLAAEAAECAKDQGKFWDYHDALYGAEIVDGHENNGNLNKNLFMTLAQNLSLDASAFGQCIDSRKYRDLIVDDSNDATALGVNSTPTVYVNGFQIRGAQPYEQFRSAIDRALQES